jgi:hypothetical protein
MVTRLCSYLVCDLAQLLRSQFTVHSSVSRSSLLVLVLPLLVPAGLLVLLLLVQYLTLTSVLSATAAAKSEQSCTATVHSADSCERDAAAAQQQQYCHYHCSTQADASALYHVATVRVPQLVHTHFTFQCTQLIHAVKKRLCCKHCVALCNGAN